MPKIKNSPVLTCEICDFTASNGYIFKRHLHRCLSLHGIASKRSSSRNPIRLKGTEGLLSKDSSQDDTEDQSSFSGMDQVSEDEMLATETNSEDILKAVSAQWGLSSDYEISINDKDEDPDAGSESDEAPSLSDASSLIPGAPYCRHYNCLECSYECKSARDYLMHQRNVHGHQMKIYACNVCDYASRYGSKVERHMAVHSKLSISLDDQQLKDEVTTSSSGLIETQAESKQHGGLVGAPSLEVDEPKIEPLKLKRLNIKMPFKVSRKSKMPTFMFKSKKRKIVKSNSISELNSKGNSEPGKEVYRMVMSQDGSNHYQCQDCLYYAAIPSSVKKHHSLCHGRLLYCSHCSFTTSGQGIYYEHLITHQGFGYVKCADCSYVTNAKSNYEKHRSFHGGQFPFHCMVCSFGADSESKIKRHVATQHKPPIVEETQSIHADGPRESVLNDEHIQEEERFSNSLLDPEMEGEFTQPDGYGENLEDLGDEPHMEYRCPKCPMICYRRGNFTRHLTSKHKFNQSSAASLSKSMESQIFKGIKLKHKRASSSSFTGIKQMRLQTENLKCSHCSYIAKWPSDLRRHMQVHTIVKRFKCSICSNKYKYLGDLNVHMRRDHNTEPPENIAREVATSDVLTKASPAIYRCPICPFTSHSKAELEQHSRQHGITEKTYQCRLCEYQTYWRGDVSRHLFRHHKIVLSKEATEIGAYFLHRPEIKPLTKQGSLGGPSSLSPLLSPNTSESMDTLGSGLASPVFKTSGKLKANKLFKNKADSSPVFVKEGSFLCEYPNCDFKTTISERLEAHVAVHLNLKQFMCPTCGKRTNWKWDVVKHMMKVHMNPAAVIEDVVTLNIDDAKSTIQEYLANYEKKAKDLTVSYCSLCPFKSLERNRVVRHMATIHKSENGKVISQTMFDSHLQDKISGQQIESGQMTLDNEDGMLMERINDQMPALKFVDPPAEELAKYDKPYACAICKKPGSSKGDVKKHYNYTHPYKDVRILYVGDGTEFNYYNGQIYHKSLKTEPSNDCPDLKSGSFAVSPLGKIPRPDSKFSNPKMHGYVKPFKCSICGLRSNWKWDLKKHLRSKHANEGGFVILLSIEEASETYGKDCTPSHPKNEDFLSIPVSAPSQVALVSPTVSTPGPTDDYIFKPPSNIKAEILPDSNGEDSEDELQSLSSFCTPSPASSPSPSPRPRHRGRDCSTFLDPSRRQWRCSRCNYISNWRRNMARHVQRKHPGEEDVVEVQALHGEPSDFSLSQCEDEESMTIDDRASGDDIDQENKQASVQSDVKTWHCSSCTFSSQLKTHIILHMQQHEIKPFLCGVCNISFMNRGPLHRHIQKVHKREDYLKLCKLNIKYDEPHDDDKRTRAEYTNCYFCRLCNIESANKQIICQHLEQVHSSADVANNIIKIQKHVGTPTKKKRSSETLSENDGGSKVNKKFHFCSICPFRTLKKSMLAFHMTYHKPNPTNKFKCKHCPYYVSALRLLHQHQRKWHKEPPSSKKQWELEKEAAERTPSPSKVSSSSSPVGTPRRNCCEKCPYTTNSKNDFIYHKQFHRPKRTAEFKCEYCDYWVVHKRLLKQHMRLHTDAKSNNSFGVDISPAKSVYSEPGLVYDPLELTELACIKQKMISAKVTACLSKSPNISPMKLASQCSVDNKPGFVNKNGLYRKLHKCRYCPYTNIRSRNMQLHEMMHGPRDSNHPLMKCPYCDYYVGSKGLLSHHMKVHQKTYGDTPDNDSEMGDAVEIEEDSDQDILPQQKADTLLQISRFKRFGCERCPYASAKRQHFVRHLELHGSRQRYTCQYCDYSVPSNNLLLQHTRLHMMPNQNLLASQSITNLQHLTEVPADVALASALPPADSDSSVTISIIHDHLGLYENNIYDSEPKKLYRCDRCPYANVRRDYLLSHLKFHMVRSALLCPYCDYSAPKQALLTQHIRVHFCPLPELSDWLLENGQTQREINHTNLDLTEALKVAHQYQNQSKKTDKGKTNENKTLSTDHLIKGKENKEGTDKEDNQLTYICQYCDREFLASDKLVKHELQHLIGSHYEATMYILNAQEKQEQQEVKHQHEEQQLEGTQVVNTYQDDQCMPETCLARSAENNFKKCPDVTNEGIMVNKSDRIIGGKRKSHVKQGREKDVRSFIDGVKGTENEGIDIQNEREDGNEGESIRKEKKDIINEREDRKEREDIWNEREDRNEEEDIRKEKEDIIIERENKRKEGEDIENEREDIIERENNRKEGEDIRNKGNDNTNDGVDIINEDTKNKGEDNKNEEEDIRKEGEVTSNEGEQHAIHGNEQNVIDA